MRDEIIKLETNLDDCTGETLSYCMEKLFEAGSIDAQEKLQYTIAPANSEILSANLSSSLSFSLSL